MKHLYVKSFFFVRAKYSEKWQNHAKICILHKIDHGLRTPNEGKKQRNLKIRADVADKICCRHT